MLSIGSQIEGSTILQRGRAVGNLIRCLASVGIVGNGGPITGYLIHKFTKYSGFQDACVRFSCPVLPFRQKCHHSNRLMLGILHFSPGCSIRVDSAMEMSLFSMYNYDGYWLLNKKIIVVRLLDNEKIAFCYYFLGIAVVRGELNMISCFIISFLPLTFFVLCSVSGFLLSIIACIFSMSITSNAIPHRNLGLPRLQFASTFWASALFLKLLHSNLHSHFIHFLLSALLTPTIILTMLFFANLDLLLLCLC